MINKVSNVSFGTNINSLKEHIKKADRLGLVTDEHIDTLEELQNDNLATELNIEFKDSVYFLTMTSPSIKEAKEIIEKGKVSKDNNSNPEYKKLNDQFMMFGDAANLISNGLPVSMVMYKDYDKKCSLSHDALVSYLKKENNLPSAIADKEQNIQAALAAYKNTHTAEEKTSENVTRRLNQLFG